MTTPTKTGQPSRRYALLTNGSPFSLAVVDALVESGNLPQLIVLPEYPPATPTANTVLTLIKQPIVHPVLRNLNNITVCYAPKARQRVMLEAFAQQGIELMLVACWPYLIETAIVDCLGDAAINLHPSRLPLFRGADPIGEQLATGEQAFAVSLHRLNEQFDAGDVVAQDDVDISGQPIDRGTVEKACASTGVALFERLLEQDQSHWKSVAQQPVDI